MGFEWFEAQIVDHYLHYYGGSMSRSFWFWLILFSSCPSDLPDAPYSMEGAIMFMDGQIIYPEESTQQPIWQSSCIMNEPVSY